MDSRHTCFGQQIGKQIDAEITQRKILHQRSVPTSAQDSNMDAGLQLDFVDASRFVTSMDRFRVDYFSSKDNRLTQAS